MPNQKTDKHGNVIDYVTHDGRYRHIRKTDPDGTVYWIRMDLRTGAVHRRDFNHDTQTWGEYKPTCGVVLIEEGEFDKEVLEVKEQGEESIIVELPEKTVEDSILDEMVRKYVTE